MKLFKPSLFFLISLGCVGCSSLSTNTACKATATDSCLTIEQVDDMTRFADDVSYARKKHHPTRPKCRKHMRHGRIVQQNNGSALWVAKEAGRQSWA